MIIHRQPVSVGTRLEYVFVNRGKGDKQDSKIEDVELNLHAVSLCSLDDPFSNLRVSREKTPKGDGRI